MLPIVKGNRIKELDQQFAVSKNITSVDLMEQASDAFSNWFCSNFEDRSLSVYVFCGSGNNGGDGLAIARLLDQKGYSVTVVYFEDVQLCSEDYQSNFNRIPESVTLVKADAWDGEIAEGSIIIDAVFGVGLNRAIGGAIHNIIDLLNSSSAIRLAVDLPTGLPAESVVDGLAFHADFTLTFQFPKLSLLFPEHIKFVGELHLLDIGIDDEFLEKFQGNSFYIRKQDILGRHKSFHRFSHKGDFGRVLLIGGAPGKLGAVSLSSYAALRTGSGLVFCAPEFEEPLEIQFPYEEIMVYQTRANADLSVMDAIGIGPGWGNAIDPDYFLSIMVRFDKPMVIDADALNLLAQNPKLIKYVPENSILTPHLKEFERLVGKMEDHSERIESASLFAVENKVILVLKGAHTLIALPDGRRLFNSSGNQYMATAGSGDVLTGMITSFLGQGYTPENAAICGVYQHGLAGEMASVAKRRGMIASDIIEKIPDTFIDLGIK
ncbi:NAD(P)H-hydrate dehydratase [Belliella marina]|uniref:Bifunctional NAD(P)H-hydrate repair enzyme n=1 Tax=Belliella marina TaxID=1644146 RepID=A0ABW4VP55_9BACT